MEQLGGQFVNVYIETVPVPEPPPPKKGSKIAQQLVGAINCLNKDQVSRLIPDEGRSIRGHKAGVGRITSNAGLKVESWTDEEDTALYVRMPS